MIPLHRYLAIVAAVSVVALAVTLGLRPDPTDERAVAANRTEANPWAAVPPTTERPRRLGAPVAAVGQAVAAADAERASRSSRRDVGGGVGGGGGGGWAALRQCENGGSYSDSTGPHFGAYQFDLQTWASVGGAGHPGSASPAEQDAAAQRLYAQRGASPWPSCGRHLG